MICIIAFMAEFWICNRLPCHVNARIVCFACLVSREDEIYLLFSTCANGHLFSLREILRSFVPLWKQLATVVIASMLLSFLLILFYCILSSSSIIVIITIDISITIIKNIGNYYCCSCYCYYYWFRFLDPAMMQCYNRESK